MIKVGFIDDYLDNWHANNYPKLISECSGGRYSVACAYGRADSPYGGMTNREWSEKTGIPLRERPEDVINECDVLMVLAPNSPETHPEIADAALRSGKLVYVDKTFAADGKTAREMFALADAHGTPCWSSSALRFTSELSGVDRGKIFRVYSEGPGAYEKYSIHQIEPVVTLMGARAQKLMFTGDPEHPSMIISFADGRYADIVQRLDPAYSFRITTVDKGNNAEFYDIRSDYFRLFVEAVIRFFDTGKVPVPHEETVDVVGIREAGMRGMGRPFEWIDI